MDFLNLDDVKSEKTNNAYLFQNTTRLLRLLEAFLLFFSLSWISAHLSPALRFSGDVLLTISSFLLNPASVFIIGNIIIIALVLYPGCSPTPSSYREEDELVTEVYADLASNGEIHAFPTVYSHEEIVYEDKQTILEVKVVDEIQNGKKNGGVADSISMTELILPEPEKCMLSVLDGGKNTQENTTCDNPDELSNDEFRRTIEAFIAKQIKFQREESLEHVLSSPLR